MRLNSRHMDIRSQATLARHTLDGEERIFDTVRARYRDHVPEAYFGEIEDSC